MLHKRYLLCDGHRTEMVTKYGSIIGPISMDSDNNEIFLGDGLFRRKPLVAENTSSRIDNEIIKF